MEQEKSDDVNTLSITGKLPVFDNNPPPPPPPPAAAAASAKKKKRRGAMQLIKVALFMLRRRRSGKSSSIEVVASRGMWNRLVGSIRPLHLQSNGSPRHGSTNSKYSIDQKCKLPNEDPIAITATQLQPMSPAASTSSSSFSSSGEDGMSRYASAGNLQELESRYASAVNLQDLDCEDDDEDEDSEYQYDENGGDEMIDVKAEEFIAQFYAQMRLQRLNSIDRRYKEMIERSIS